MTRRINPWHASVMEAFYAAKFAWEAECEAAVSLWPHLRLSDRSRVQAGERCDMIPTRTRLTPMGEMVMAFIVCLATLLAAIVVGVMCAAYPGVVVPLVGVTACWWAFRRAA